jgi:hypothetical protein
MKTTRYRVFKSKTLSMSVFSTNWRFSGAVPRQVLLPVPGALGKMGTLPRGHAQKAAEASWFAGTLFAPLISGNGHHCLSEEQW